MSKSMNVLVVVACAMCAMLSAADARYNIYTGGNAKAHYDDHLDGLDQCEAEMKKLCGVHKNTGMQCFECLHEHVKVLKPLCAHTGNGRKFCAKNSFRDQVKKVQRNEVRTQPYPSFDMEEGNDYDRRRLFANRNTNSKPTRRLITWKQVKKVQRKVGKRQKDWNEGYVWKFDSNEEDNYDNLYDSYDDEIGFGNRGMTCMRVCRDGSSGCRCPEDFDMEDEVGKTVQRNKVGTQPYQSFDMEEGNDYDLYDDEIGFGNRGMTCMRVCRDGSSGCRCPEDFDM